MTDTTTRAAVRRVALDQIEPHPENPKAHDLDVIQASIRRFGFVEPIVVDQRTGLNVSGHGRVEALQAMRAAGEPPPDGIAADWKAPVYVGWASASDDEARAALIALNRAGERGGWQDEPLLTLLDRLAEVDDGMVGVGFDTAEVDELRARLAELDEPEPPPAPPQPWPHRAAGEATCRVLEGDLFDRLPELDADSIDAVVCDPPYALGFMGKAWDRHTAAEFGGWCERWAREALRVVKPGGYLVAFGGTRTHHRLMAGLEDAGWEIRDCGVWLYRSGFPKSLDVSKAIDRAHGEERPDRRTAEPGGNRVFQPTVGVEDKGTPVTRDVATWDGWGTALKPAVEPWVLARRPLSEGTVAANVLRWGTGALNIDGCRPETTEEERAAWPSWAGVPNSESAPVGPVRTEPAQPDPAGRWPANVVTLEDDEDLRYFRAAAGQVVDVPKAGSDEKPWDSTPADADSNDDLHPTVKPLALMRHLCRLVTPPGGTVLDPFAGSGTTGEAALIEGYDAVLVESHGPYVELIRRRLARTDPDQPAV